MLRVDPSMAPRSLKNHSKTKQNRKLETLHQLANQFSRNLYKNNIKINEMLRSPKPFKKTVKQNKIEN